MKFHVREAFDMAGIKPWPLDVIAAGNTFDTPDVHDLSWPRLMLALTPFWQRKKKWP